MARIISLEKLRDHYADHFHWAVSYVDKANKVYHTQLFVNTSALYIAVKSAYDDIERYKIYHQEDPQRHKSNSVKRVAYLTKWIVKTRPIQYTPVSGAKDLIPLLANAGYALTVSRSHISGEIKKEFFFSSEKMTEFVYDLTYREITGDALLAIFQNYYDLLLGKSPFEDLDGEEPLQRP